MDHKVKIKESKNIRKHLNLAWEQKMMWNVRVIVIPNVVGKLGTIPNNLKRGKKGLEISGRTETIETTVLLWLTRILRRVLETREDLLSSRILKKEKNSQILLVLLLLLIIINQITKSCTTHDGTLTQKTKGLSDYIQEINNFSRLPKIYK